MQNNTEDKTTRPFSHNQIWQEIKNQAQAAGLDPQKFTEAHQEIVQQIIDFLLDSQITATAQNEPSTTLPQKLVRNSTWLPNRFSKRLEPESDPVKPVAPIIICGEPGTGKTTFLYLLDTILRQAFELPDNIKPVMRKRNGRSYPLFKRAFNGTAVSLLSVKKWSQLLHFYAWDVERHKLDSSDLDQFIQETLVPMRLLFADEVEMTGYSPTIPDLAKHGILVVGSSNQYEFKQLVDRDIPPRIYRFQGIDMRLGNPMDAVVTAVDPLVSLFENLAQQEPHQIERLSYRSLHEGSTTYLLFDFQNAVAAPFLETDWIQFLQQFQPDTADKLTAVTLLFEAFSLAVLQANYNAIIRFVSLFDAIEQLGLGVLVQNTAGIPELSKAAITNLKTHIYNAIGVPEEIKQKTVVGLDRCTSRLGQAGHKARLTVTKPESA